MIPRTFPSIIEAFQTKMVVYVLPSISGLKAWIDYIPVKGVVTEDPVLANTYANAGYQVVKSQESLTGQAWLDYIPVYEDASYNKPWSTDAGGYIPVGGLFSPASFFANGEQGWWYDPSNFATLFQDSAGTTPVTAVEQPVGLQLDLSKGLVLGPELVSGAASAYTGNGTVSTVGDTITATCTTNGTYGIRWAASNISNIWTRCVFEVVTNSASKSLNFYPNLAHPGVTVGTTTGNKTYTIFAPTASGGNQIPVFFISGLAGESFSVRLVTVKELPGNHRFQSTSANRPVVSARVNLFVGTATLSTQSVTTRATTHTLTFTGAGSITLTGTAIGIYTAGTYSVTTTAGTLTATVLGTVTQADLRETNVGVGLPAYQAVVTSTNYDSTGFPIYIKPNGSNQFMVTNSINFSSTDKMTVWQGVRKLSDATLAILAEISIDANPAANPGSWFIAAPRRNPGPGDYAFRTSGTASAEPNTGNLFAAPITNVLTAIGNISGDVATLRINGVQAATSSADQGTGNYGTYPAYFYMRAGTTLPFNGNDYGSIARGAASTAAQIANGEAYINSKTKAYTP
jgi:hypothetical protein